MAEGNDPGTTPPVPVNPFVGGGFEQNIDQQKGFQNDLIAQQGQGIRALYERTGASAKEVLQSQLSAAGGNPTARTALFQAYVDDAKAGEARSAQSVQRQAALGNMFMDQTKAAIPLYAKNVDATTEAMRLQFEERRRKEEQNYQLQRAQLASSNANRAKTGAAKGEEDAEEERAYWLKRDPEGLDPDNPINKAKRALGSGETVEKARTAGRYVPPLDFEKVGTAYNLPNWANLKKSNPAVETVSRNIQDQIDGMASEKGITFDDVLSRVQSMAEDPLYEMQPEIRRALVNYAMGSNAGRWGVSDPERWGYVKSKYINQPLTFPAGFNPGNYSVGVGR